MPEEVNCLSLQEYWKKREGEKRKEDGRGRNEGREGWMLEVEC